MELKYKEKVTLERVLVQETCGNILSYNTLQQLGIAYKIQETKEKKEPLLKIMSAVPEKKKSACEASWAEIEGNIKCKCPKWELPQKISDKAIKTKFDLLVQNEKEKDKNEVMKRLISHHFSKSALNQCQTQPLNKMSVDPMRVVFKSNETSTQVLKAGASYFAFLCCLRFVFFVFFCVFTLFCFFCANSWRPSVFFTFVFLYFCTLSLC